jgi:PTEN phosphatase family protein
MHHVIIDSTNCIFREMLEYAQSTRRWLEADPENIIAVHCKGGKGRTGTMICVWLVESGAFDEAKVYCNLP